MKRKGFILLLFLAAPVAEAQFSYIVPVAGTGSGFEMFYGSDAQVTNAGSGPAFVHIGTSYYPPAAQVCLAIPPPPIRLLPGQSAHVNPFCGALQAYTIESDQPLAVTATARIRFTDDCLSASAEQKLDIATAFTPANVVSVVAEFNNGQTWRAKLVVINPNDRPISVRADVTRYDSSLRGSLGTLSRTYTVQPRSLLFQPLEEVPVVPPPDDPDFLIVPVHAIRVSADGDYLAGVTDVTTALHMAEYRGAVPLAR